jgi:hypothetical protein
MPVIAAGQDFFLSLRVSPRLYSELELRRLALYNETGVNVSLAKVARMTLAKALGVVDDAPPSPTERAGARRGVLRKKKERP